MTIRLEKMFPEKRIDSSAYYQLIDEDTGKKIEGVTCIEIILNAQDDFPYAVLYKVEFNEDGTVSDATREYLICHNVSFEAERNEDVEGVA